MKSKLFRFIGVALCLSVPNAQAHGRSEEMNRVLNAKPPEWLSIGVPVKVDSTATLPVDGMVFRSRSGGATNSRNRIQIPNRGIQIEVDYSIVWSGNNDAGTGVSLSPDGNRLLVNGADLTGHLYEIQPNGTFLEVPLQLPLVTYDAGDKGFIRGWSWANDQVLTATADITDETGDMVIENRVYVFHMKEKILSRLDLSALGIAKTDFIEVVGFWNDLLKISVGDTFVIAKADLKTPPRIEKQEIELPATAQLVEPKRQASKAPEKKLTSSPGGEPTSTTPWGIIVALVVAALGLLWLVLKRRSWV